MEISSFLVPRDGTVAVYVNNRLLLRMEEVVAAVRLPDLPPGLHSIAVSLQDKSLDVVVESEIEIQYERFDQSPPLWNFADGIPAPSSRTKHFRVIDSKQLTVIWTCPDWEIDWISKILREGNLEFEIIKDPDMKVLAPNSLIALSQNDERNRSPDRLARYLLEFRARNFRVGVLHMSDEDYTAPVYFYPWVHYVIRNHYQEEMAKLPHVIAIPLGYKKGFGTLEQQELSKNTIANQSQAAHPQSRQDSRNNELRQYTWNFVGQTHDKPTRRAMLAAAQRIGGGFLRLTAYWNDPSGLSTAEFRHVLERSAFTLCPRGFVHPESFRLWEALEAGSVPIVEDDAYFDALLGSKWHPLPALPPPPGCPRPATTRHHPLPHPAPPCDDVWPGLERALRRWEKQLPQLQVETRRWWGEVKHNFTLRVAALIRHGADWQRHTGGGDGSGWKAAAVDSGAGDGLESVEAMHSSNAFVVTAAGAASTGGSGPAWGIAKARPRSRYDNTPPPLGRGESARGGIVAKTEEVKAEVQQSPPRGPTQAPAPPKQCHHHDLHCRALEVASQPLDEESHAVLHASIAEARTMAGALFPSLAATASSATVGGQGGNLGGAAATAVDQAAVEDGDRPEERDIGRYPAGPCEDDCDCPGTRACVRGACAPGTEGLCPPRNAAAAAALGRFAAAVVVNMNASEADRERWRRSAAQLRKFGLNATRHAGVDGAALGSAEMQALLNSGVLSPQHDALVMDGTRSVVGCALVHLELFEWWAAEAEPEAWLLVLEDDFLLPPHFATLLAHSWAAVPPAAAVDLLYLGAGSNGRGPLAWVNRRVMRPAQTVGTHAYAVTGRGAARLLVALRPLHQSIDSQIHETLLDALDIYALATPDAPPAAAPGAAEFRPYASPPPALGPLQPYTATLAEPDFFPRGSYYHGLVSVDQEVPSTIPKLVSAGQPGRPAAFFVQPLEGDVSTTGDVTVTVVVHNFAVWAPDGSAPAGLERGHALVEINGRELARCGQRTCGMTVIGLPDGSARLRVSLRAPPSKGGGQVGDAAEVEIFVCTAGERRCVAGECFCDSGHSVDVGTDLGIDDAMLREREPYVD